MTSHQRLDFVDVLNDLCDTLYFKPACLNQLSSRCPTLDTVAGSPNFLAKLTRVARLLSDFELVTQRGKNQRSRFYFQLHHVAVANQKLYAMTLTLLVY